MPDVALPEKRKVGSSTLPLTPHQWRAYLGKRSYRALYPYQTTARYGPFVTAVRREMSHGIRTVALGVWMVIVGPVVLHGVIGSTLITASRAGHFVGVGLITAGHGAGGTSLDWPSLAVSIVAAAIALFAVIYSAKSTHAAQDSAGSGKRSADAAERAAAAAERAAAAAEQQTEIQLQLRKGAAEPYVWVDVRPDDVTDVLLNLVVGNSGPTIAQNVRAKIDPPLEAIDQLKDRAETAQDLLARGISSLPPGRTLVWPLGQGFNILNGNRPQKHTVTVTADGPFGPVPPLTYVLDLMDYKGHMHRPVGSLHLLTKAVENIETKLSARALERSTPDTLH